MKAVILLFSVLFVTTLYSQTPEVIKVKKTNTNLYFFQKGNSSDTITKTKGNLFYLIVKDTLKNRLNIFIENGQLVKTNNDSVFKLNYVKGMAYECVFVKSVTTELKNKVITKYDFKCLINGVSAEESKKIIFRFRLKNEPNNLLVNTFYFKE